MKTRSVKVIQCHSRQREKVTPNIETEKSNNHSTFTHQNQKIAHICVNISKKYNMNRYTVITMMIIIILNNAKEVLACPSQTSNIDIHDLLKQKQMLNGGKQALANENLQPFYLHIIKCNKKHNRLRNSLL